MAKMKYMESYGSSSGSGYTPPKGSAGKEARGEFSSKKNPRSVPKKGSEISAMSDYGMTADKSKMHGLIKEQARKEDQRGMGC